MLTIAAFFASVAFAEPVAVDFQPPASIKLFTELNVFNGTGSVKTGDCKAAYTAALADAQATATKRKFTDNIAVFAQKDLSDFVQATSLECEIKGDPAAPKGAVVKLKLLASKPGTDAAFPTVSAARTYDIVAAMIAPGSMVGAQIDGLTFDARNGKIYQRVTVNLKAEEAPHGNRNNKTVTIFREQVTPNMTSLVARASKVDEVFGAHYVVNYPTTNKAGEAITEGLHFWIPEDKEPEFTAGNLSEQEFLNAASVQLSTDGATPVKLDVSVVDAAE